MRYFILCSFLLSLQMLQAQSEASFHIMSFNIRFANPLDGVNYWDNRKDLVVSMIRYHEADIIGLQEALRRQMDDLKAALPDYEWVGVCRTDGTQNPNPDNEFSAILYNAKRFEWLEGNTFWLSETPDIVASIGWDAALPRVVTWAKFKDKITQKIFFHFNTHFDHRGEKAREESAELLQSKVKTIAKETPTIITGDFNANDISLMYRILVNETHANHFKDAIQVTELPHHGPLATWSAFQFPGEPGRRIDYIFIKNNVKVKKHAILSDSWSGRFPSDHLPVMAQVLIE